MRITQCYISKSVNDFPWQSVYGLTEYIDSAAPCLFIGCYNEDDICAILEHESLAVIMWCGQDSNDFPYWRLFDKPHIKHLSGGNVSAHIRNYRFCYEKKANNLEGRIVDPVKKGDKIFVYMPKGSEQYHGKETFDKLKLNYEYIIGDGSISQEDWRAGKADEIYSQCFIGLFLNRYSGGVTGIVEMGVRGIKVVTNAFSLPNVINWKTTRDIETAINEESKNIGKINKKLSTFVNDCLDKDFEFLNTKFYGVQ